MVMQNLNRIKNIIPGAIQAIIFYSNGFVFNTSSEENINVPKWGEMLAQILDNFAHLLKIHDPEEVGYKKILYETDKYLIAIVKLGEDSNLALLLDNTLAKDVKIGPIKHYLDKLNHLVDMDQSELQSQSDPNSQDPNAS